MAIQYSRGYRIHYDTGQSLPNHALPETTPALIDATPALIDDDVISNNETPREAECSRS